jgi:hypothetical protein
MASSLADHSETTPTHSMDIVTADRLSAPQMGIQTARSVTEPQKSSQLSSTACIPLSTSKTILAAATSMQQGTSPDKQLPRHLYRPNKLPSLLKAVHLVDKIYHAVPMLEAREALWDPGGPLDLYVEGAFRSWTPKW